MKKLASFRKGSKQRLDDDEDDGSFSGSAIMPGGDISFGSTGPSEATSRPSTAPAVKGKQRSFSFNRLRRKGSSSSAAAPAPASAYGTYSMPYAMPGGATGGSPRNSGATAPTPDGRAIAAQYDRQVVHDTARLSGGGGGGGSRRSSAEELERQEQEELELALAISMSLEAENQAAPPAPADADAEDADLQRALELSRQESAAAAASRPTPPGDLMSDAPAQPYSFERPAQPSPPTQPPPSSISDDLASLMDATPSSRPNPLAPPVFAPASPVLTPAAPPGAGFGFDTAPLGGCASAVAVGQPVGVPVPAAGPGAAFGGWGPTAGCAQFVAHSPAATAAAGSPPPQPNPFVAAGGGMNPFVQQPSPPNGGLL